MPAIATNIHAFAARRLGTPNKAIRTHNGRSIQSSFVIIVAVRDRVVARPPAVVQNGRSALTPTRSPRKGCADCGGRRRRRRFG